MISVLICLIRYIAAIHAWKGTWARMTLDIIWFQSVITSIALGFTNDEQPHFNTIFWNLRVLFSIFLLTINVEPLVSNFSV